MALRGIGEVDWQTKDPQSIKDNDEAKRCYSQLRRSHQQDEVYRKNLQKKLTKIKADLDARVEEVENLQRSLQVQANKGTDDFEGVKREKELKVREQDERIRDVLSEVLYSKPPASGKAWKLDTVMVSFSKNTVDDGDEVDDEGKPKKTTRRMRYNLAFKVDEQTTLHELRASVCRYWALPQEDYVLKTMAGNKCQDEILVKECFKQGEIAQLLLEKTQRRPSEKPTDDELKAIQPLQPRKSSKKKNQQQGYDAAGVAALSKQHDNYSLELRRLGGIYFMLRTPAAKPSEHSHKIKLRDLAIYVALAALSIYAYDLARPEGTDYWLRTSFEEQITKSWETPDGDAIPGLGSLRTNGDMWNWLNYTLPSVLFPMDIVNLRDFNTILGPVAIRVQSVREQETPSGICEFNDEVVKALSSRGAVCYPSDVTDDTEDKVDVPGLQDYWNGMVANEATEDITSRLRGPSSPWVWRSSEYNEREHGIQRIDGLVQKYEASGYMAEFNMAQYEKLEEYQQDMGFLRQVGWISRRTRALFISFTAFNQDYDMWVTTDILIESVPAETVRTQWHVKPFRPNVQETRDELVQIYVDYVRLVISFYIGVFQGMAERRHKIGNHKAGCWYHVSLNGICDMGIVACIWTGAILRNTVLYERTTKEWLEMASVKFYSFTYIGSMYLSMYSVEGVLMIFVMYRLVSFFRLSRNVYMMWATLGKALKSLVFVCLFFLPTCLGIIFIFHSLYGAYFKEYALIRRTLLQFYFLVEGDLEMDRLLKLEPTWMLLLMVIIYTVLVFIVFNLLVVVVVEAYYYKFMTLPQGETWGTARKLKWVVPGFIVTLMQSLTQSSSSTEATSS